MIAGIHNSQEVMIAGIHNSQEISAIDVLTALKPSLKSVKKWCTSERFLVNIFLTNTDIAETKVSLESL